MFWCCDLYFKVRTCYVVALNMSFCFPLVSDWLSKSRHTTERERERERQWSQEVDRQTSVVFMDLCQIAMAVAYGRTRCWPGAKG